MTTEQQILAHTKLLLAIQNPDYEDLYWEGYHDAQNSIDSEANPYPIGSKAYHYWLEGWNNAFYEEEPMFNPRGINAVAYMAPTKSTTLKASSKNFIELMMATISGLVFFAIYDYVT